MFRTVEGFFETARLTFKRPTSNPLPYEEAKRWAPVNSISVLTDVEKDILREIISLKR